MKRVFFVFTLILAGVQLSLAQFHGGMYSSNYAGVLGLTINPATTNYLHNGTDVLIFNYSASGLNNGLYMDPKPITSIISPDILKAFSDPEGGENVNETFDRVFDMKTDVKDKNYIFADMTIAGPSLLINQGRHSFGITTQYKSNSGTVHMDPGMTTFLLKGVGAADIQGKTIPLHDMFSGTMVYGDVGVNYSYQIVDSYKSVQRLGITAHYLRGSNSLIFKDLGGTTWTFVGDSTVYFDNGNFSYIYAADKATELNEVLTTKGSGFAVDLGYTYVRKSRMRPTNLTVCPNIRFGGRIRQYQEYKWKLGVALMDLGFINFTQSAVSTTYRNTYGPTRNLDLAFYNGIFALDRKLRYDFSGNPGTQFTLDNQYTQLTASRLNVQFDYKFRDNYYFSFLGTQRVFIPSSLAMRAPNIMTVSARYEERRFEVGMPLSLIEYQYPVLGLNFRVGPFYMGTNHFTEMIGLRKIKGLDIFFGLKFNLSNHRGV